MAQPHRRRGNSGRHSEATAPIRLVSSDTLSGEDEAELLDLLTPRLPSGGPVVQLVPDDRALQHAAQRLAAHRRTAQEILDRSVPENTRRTYASHVRAWAKWCRERGAVAMPGDPAEVVLFLTAYAVQFNDGEAVRTEADELVQARAVSSIAVRAAALFKIHHHAGLPSPTEDPTVQDFLAGLRRMFHVRAKNAKAAVDLDALERLVGACRPQPGHLRRWALILLRARTEISVAAARELTWADIDLEAATIDIVGRGGSLRRWQLDRHPDERLDLVPVLQVLRQRARHLEHVFVDEDGARITRQSLHQTLRLAERATGPLPAARASRLLDLHTTVVDSGMAKVRRDVALLTCGWWAARRRSELSALKWRDMVRRPDGHWAITIRRSKTDQEGQGATLFLPRTEEALALICPARAMDAWHEHVRRVTGVDPLRRLGSVPVFGSVDRHGRLPNDPERIEPIPDHTINTLVQELARAAGVDTDIDLDRSAYGAHSLRAGFVTEALRGAKLNVEEVQQVTLHQSLDVLLQYRREIESFETSPVHTMLGKLRGRDH